MAASPRLSPASAANITCNGILLSQYPAGQAICPCKQEQSYPLIGYDLLNYTAIASPPSGSCSTQGCTSGQRPFRTATLQTMDDYFRNISLTLFETACQGGLIGAQLHSPGQRGDCSSNMIELIMNVQYDDSCVLPQSSD